MKNRTIAFLLLCVMITFSACGKAPGISGPADTQGEESTAATSDIPAESEPTESFTESSTPEETTSRQEDKTAVNSKTAESSSKGDTSSTDKPADPKPTQPSTSSATPPPADPPAKSIYDRPYNIDEIEKDMEKYIVGKGGNYRWDLNLDNCGHWVDPLPTSSKWYGDKLKNTLLEDIDERMSRGLYSKFRVYFKPISGGEYEIIVLCG